MLIDCNFMHSYSAIFFHFRSYPFHTVFFDLLLFVVYLVCHSRSCNYVPWHTLRNNSIDRSHHHKSTIPAVANLVSGRYNLLKAPTPVEWCIARGGGRHGRTGILRRGSAPQVFPGNPDHGVLVLRHVHDQKGIGFFVVAAVISCGIRGLSICDSHSHLVGEIGVSKSVNGKGYWESSKTD